MPGSAGSATRRYVHSTAQPRRASANAMAAPMPWHRSRSPCGHRPEPGPGERGGVRAARDRAWGKGWSVPPGPPGGLAECGTHALTAATMGACTTGETTLARDLLPALGEGILVLADRNCRCGCVGRASGSFMTAHADHGGVSLTGNSPAWCPENSSLMCKG